MEIRNDSGQIEVKFDDTNIAIGAIVDFRPSPLGSREIVISHTAGAYRLIDTTFVIESACSAIHVLARIRTSEIGSINQCGSIVADTYKVIIVVVGRQLKSVIGHGQSRRTALPTVGNGTSPPRHINIVAQIH